MSAETSLVFFYYYYYILKWRKRRRERKKKVCVLTQVKLMDGWSETKMCIFVECIQNLRLDLTNSITVENFTLNLLIQLFLDHLERLYKKIRAHSSKSQKREKSKRYVLSIGKESKGMPRKFCVLFFSICQLKPHPYTWSLLSLYTKSKS